jgi:hypothetical protein
MVEERLVEATDDELLAGTCKRVLSTLKGVVASGVDCMLADEGVVCLQMALKEVHLTTWRAMA